MQFAITPPPPRTLAIAGRAERFPVHRIYCVGRNYAAHAKEMGGDAREPPFFFMKPGSAAVDACAPLVIAYPPKTANFHHEVELVAALAHGGSNIPIGSALDCVYGYAVGLDMTRRDLQLAARDKGRPWEFGKSFMDSAPIAALHRAADIGHPAAAPITLAVNGQIKQSSDISKLIWSVAECIAELSQYDRLEAGDLIMTGTPEGVGPVGPGDEMVGAITGLVEIRVRVAG
jgi:fumarylpyruvate hydrolase